MCVCFEDLESTHQNCIHTSHVDPFKKDQQCIELTHTYCNLLACVNTTLWLRASSYYDEGVH